MVYMAFFIILIVWWLFIFLILSIIFVRIPSYFGTIPAAEAARKILDGVRRNYAEFSVPGYLLYLGHILRYISDFYKPTEVKNN